MPGDELQNVVLRLAEQNEHVQAAFYRIWKEKEREARLRKSVEWEPGDWSAARQRFQPRIEDELRDCAALFYDRYADNDYDSDEGRWDYSKGLERLDGWLAQFLEMAADGDWIDASVGLLLTLQRLDDWAMENGDEDLGCEDLQEECHSFWAKPDELAAVIRNGAAPDANKGAFFHELMDWIARVCREGDDWETWSEPLRLCLFSPAHYERLREHMLQWEPTLVSDSLTEEPVATELVRWWVRSSLDTDHETEAQQAEAKLTAFDVETSACFVRYYEQWDRMDEAIARLQSIIGHLQENQQKLSDPLESRFSYGYPSQANHYYEWLVTILVKTGRQKEADTWYVQWFEAVPSLELFKICLDTVPPEERTLQAQKWIAYVRSLEGYQDLLMDMHLHVNDPDGAWQVYLEQSRRFASSLLSRSARRVFDAITVHDPIRLVPILQQFAEKSIAAKNRSSYQRATQWLTELKSVYGRMNQTDEWNQYLRSLRDTHRRLPALQDELLKAKL